MRNDFMNRFLLSTFVALCLTTSGTSYSQVEPMQLTKDKFSKEDALHACPKIGKGWSNVEFESLTSEPPKITLPAEVFASITEGDHMFAVVVDTKKWSNRSPKLDEKFQVICEYSEAIGSLPAPDTEKEIQKKVDDYQKNHTSELAAAASERKSASDRLDKTLMSIEAPTCALHHIYLTYQNMFPKGIYCVPTEFYDQAMKGIYWQGVRYWKAAGYKTKNINDPVCGKTLDLYRKQAVDSYIKAINFQNKQDVESSKTFIDNVSKFAGKSCTVEFEKSWEDQQLKKQEDYWKGKSK